MSIPASAVQDMSVAEVRQALGQVRKMWCQSSPSSPLFISSNLVRHKSVAEFSTEFVYGHHLKRHKKSTQQLRLSSANDMSSLGEMSSKHVSGIAGPKGDHDDPFPFTPGWRLKAVDAGPAHVWWERSRNSSPPLHEAQRNASPARPTKRQRRKG